MTTTPPAYPTPVRAPPRRPGRLPGEYRQPLARGGRVPGRGNPAASTPPRRPPGRCRGSWTCATATRSWRPRWWRSSSTSPSRTPAMTDPPGPLPRAEPSADARQSAGRCRHRRVPAGPGGRGRVRRRPVAGPAPGRGRRAGRLPAGRGVFGDLVSPLLAPPDSTRSHPMAAADSTRTAFREADRGPAAGAAAGRGSATTRSWASWPAAGWAWCTGPGS